MSANQYLPLFFPIPYVNNAIHFIDPVIHQNSTATNKQYDNWFSLVATALISSSWWPGNESSYPCPGTRLVYTHCYNCCISFCAAKTASRIFCFQSLATSTFHISLRWVRYWVQRIQCVYRIPFILFKIIISKQRAVCLFFPVVNY